MTDVTFPARTADPGAVPGTAAASRYAIFVDAGYLFAAAGQIAHRTTDRRRIRLDAIGLIGVLEGRAHAMLGGQLLRVYWFDGAKDRVPTVQQREIAAHRGVKVRLGNLNAAGQQKGVDALLRSDLEGLARNRAITDVALLAGDEDMLPAVEAAQACGVRVHLWRVEPEFGRNTSERLEWEADTVGALSREDVAPFVALAGASDTGSSAARPATTGDAAAGAGVGSRVVAPSPALLARAPRPSLPVAASRVVYASATGTDGDGMAPLPAELAAQYRGREADWMLEVGEHVATKWLVERGRENLADLLPGPHLPAVIDQELLVAGEGMIGFSLRPYKGSRSLLRNGFWARLYREFGIAEAS